MNLHQSVWTWQKVFFGDAALIKLEVAQALSITIDQALENRIDVHVIKKRL